MPTLFSEEEDRGAAPGWDRPNAQVVATREEELESIDPTEKTLLRTALLHSCYTVRWS